MFIVNQILNQRDSEEIINLTWIINDETKQVFKWHVSPL